MRQERAVTSFSHGVWGSALQPLIDPAIHRLVPEAAVLRLEYPVALVWEIQHLRRYAEALQRIEELEAFAGVEAIVELAVHDQRRRLDGGDVQVRRPAAVHFPVRPRRALELPLV